VVATVPDVLKRTRSETNGIWSWQLLQQMP